MVQPRISYEYVTDPIDPSAAPRPRRVFDTTTIGGGGINRWWNSGGGGRAKGGGYVPVEDRPLPPIAGSSHSAAQNLTFGSTPAPFQVSGLTQPSQPIPLPTPAFPSLPQPESNGPNPQTHANHKVHKIHKSKPWYSTDPFSTKPVDPSATRHLPQPHPEGTKPPWVTPPVLLQPTPLPPGIEYMSRGERKYWLKMRDDQLKAIRKMEKAAKDQMKAQEKERRNREEFEYKKRKLEAKQKRKYEKWLAKHPYRPLPIPSPRGGGGSAGQNTMAEASAPLGGVEPDPLSFMLLHTGEEFGIRRPFDAPGLPRGLGGPPGQAGWPMMSRTMTQAVTDLDREERVHAIQAGRYHALNW